jgi:hypothetical protein
VIVWVFRDLTKRRISSVPYLFYSTYEYLLSTRILSTGGGHSTSTACHPNADWMYTNQVIEVQSKISIR